MLQSVFSLSQYYRLPHVIIGGYDNVRDDDGEPVPLQFRLRQYREAELNISESRFVLDGHVDELYCKSSVEWFEDSSLSSFLTVNFSRSSQQNVSQQLFDVSQDPNFHK